MEFSELRNEAEKLSKKLKRIKISYGTVKEVIVAPVASDDGYWLYFKALLQGHHIPEMAKHNSHAKDFDLYVSFEEIPEGKDISIELFTDCKPAFESLGLSFEK